MRADRRAAVLGAERLARVVDQREPVPVGDRAQLVELARVAEDVDGDDRARTRRDRGLDRGGVEVERARIDVGEDWRGALVDRAVRRGDEGVRRGDHLVTRLDARQAHAEVQSGRTGGDRRDVGGADGLGEQLLEAGAHRAEREPPRPQHLEHELLVALVEPGCGETDRAEAYGL